MHPSEEGFLKEMLYESLFVAEGKAPYPRSVLELPELAKYYLNWGSIPHDLAVVAEKERQLIGAVWGRAHQPPHEGYGFVDIDIPEVGIAICADYRNQGLGTKLFESLFEKYYERGVRAVSLSVDQHNPAKTLYSRLGFQVVVENKQDFIMQKVLRS